MVSPEEKRRRRIQELAQWLHDAPNGRSMRDRVSGKGAYLWGCRKETVTEYLEVLRLSGLIDYTDDTIYWVGKE